MPPHSCPSANSPHKPVTLIDEPTLVYESLDVPHFAMQTYEGGLGGEPGNEAHGGYTFCGVAALMLVGQAHQLDLPRLIHWAVHMQVRTLGINKLAALISLSACTAWLYHL